MAGYIVIWSIQSIAVDVEIQVHQKHLAQGALINLVGKIIGRAIHMATQILLARLLGPFLFGLYAIGWNLLRVGTTILPFGVDIALLQLGPKWWSRKRENLNRLLRTSGQFIFFIGLVLGAFFYVSASSIAEFYAKPELEAVMRLLAMALPLALFLRVSAFATRISQKMQFGIIAEELIQPLSNLVLAIVLIAIGYSLVGALWATAISFLAALIYTLYVILDQFPDILPLNFKLDRKMFVQLWATASPLAAAAVFTTLILLADRLMVGFLLSEAEAGIYQAASIFAVYFVTILSAFKTIVAPMVAAAHSQGNHNTVVQSYRLSTRWGIYLSLPVATVLVLLPGTTLQVLFGSEYLLGAAVLLTLTIGQFANVLSGPVEYYLIMTGSSKTWVLINAVMLLVDVVLNLIMIPRLGILGAAVASGITFALTSATSLVAVRMNLGVWPYDVGYRKGLIAMTGMIVVLSALNLIAIQPLWLKLLSVAIVAPASFFFILSKLGLEATERQLLASIFRKITA